MIVSMLEGVQPETPLGSLLPSYVTRILAKNGIRTIEGVHKAYPLELVTMRGIGMLRFKQIEAVLFPGKSFVPRRVYSPIRRIKGSSLNGALSPATVQALARGGITTVDELLVTAPQDLLKIWGFSVAKLREIESIFYTHSE